MDISENTLLQQLQNDLNDLRDTVNKQQEELRLLKENVISLTCKRNEKFYQKLLEQDLGGGHKNTKYGITDITTDVYHVEIKHWCNFKACLGQLQAYNHNDDKKLIAAFFGDIANIKKLDIIQLFHDSGVDVWELCDFDNGVRIIKHKVEDNDNSFKEWLHDHVFYKHGSQTTLKTIIQTFFGHPLPSRKAAVYRLQVEGYIKNRFPRIDWKYKDSIYDSKRFRGWLHVELKSEEDVKDKNETNDLSQGTV